MNDETVNVNKHTLYEKACATLGSPSGIGGYDPSNMNMKNRVLQELFGKNFIREGDTKNEIKITYNGKSSPGFI